MTDGAPRTLTGRPVLLTVSGAIPDDLDAAIARGDRPRADYDALAAAFDADLLDVAGARALTGRVGAIVERVGGAAAVIALAAFRLRRRYEVIVTDGEQVGLPLAAMCRALGRRRARHVMIVHILSVPKKVRLIKALRLARLVDRYVVYSSAQRDFITGELGVPAGDVVLTPFMVDTAFFAPGASTVPRRRMICSAGLERRDYTTMIEAVRDLDVEVVIAAASPWSKWSDSSAGTSPPPNVTIERFGFRDLRDLYEASALVVVPLDDVDFQAGITTILEAMAMQRAVVCTRSPGQTDTIVDGSTGRYVPVRDVAALRSTIVALLADEEQAARLGAGAREWVCEHGDIEVYAARLSGVVSSLRTAAS